MSELEQAREALKSFMELKGHWVDMYGNDYYQKKLHALGTRVRRLYEDEYEQQINNNR